MDDDGERVSFDLNESLKYYNDNPNSVPCTDADSELLDAESEPEALSNAQISQILEPIIDSIAVNPDAIARPSNFDSLQCLLKYVTRSSPPYSRISANEGTLIGISIRFLYKLSVRSSTSSPPASPQRQKLRIRTSKVKSRTPLRITENFSRCMDSFSGGRLLRWKAVRRTKPLLLRLLLDEKVKVKGKRRLAVGLGILQHILSWLWRRCAKCLN